MLEIVIDRRGEIAIDNLEWLMDQFPAHARRAMASALKSEGYRLSQLIKLVIAGRGVDGSWPMLNPHTGVLKKKNYSWTSGGMRKSIKNYRTIWRGKKGEKEMIRSYNYLSGDRKGQRRVMLSTLKEPQLKIRNAVGYSYDENTNSVDISIAGGSDKNKIYKSFQGGIFTSRRDRMRFLMHLQSEGYSKTITPKMRKMFFALGFPIKKETTTLKVPKRESIQPVFDQQKNTIVKNLEEKFTASLNRYIFGGTKS